MPEVPISSAPLPGSNDTSRPLTFRLTFSARPCTSLTDIQHVALSQRIFESEGSDDRDDLSKVACIATVARYTATGNMPRQRFPDLAAASMVSCDGRRMAVSRCV